MKRITFIIISLLAICTSPFTMTSCKDGETYAELKDKEKNAIAAFLKDNDITGPIKVITESEFKAHDCTTDVASNEFVLFEEDGVYLQIRRKGAGRTLDDMAGDFADSTVNKTILCRFIEYDIENADTTYANVLTPSVVDKMLVKYSRYSRSYEGTFTNGYMLKYHESMVMKGWMRPLNYIRLTKDAGQSASVRLIVPHSSGTNNASQYVLPFYYEVTYQLGK